jgi:histone deacetylase complex regulatory component SIN3
MEEDEDSEGGRPVRPNTIRVAPVPSRYKLLINNKATPPIARPTAANTVGRSIISNGGGSAKSTATASVSKNQKAGSTGIPTSTAPADSQPKDSAPQASAGGGGMDPVRPVGQVSMDRSVGDFAFALVANLYHKRRESLLRFIEALEGDPNAMVD